MQCASHSSATGAFRAINNSIADAHERQFAEGRNESDTAHGPEGLEQAFHSSELYRNFVKETEAYRVSLDTEKQDQEAFKQSVLDDKRKGVSKTSPYTLGYWGQIKALTVRQFRLRLQDSFTILTSFTMSIVL